MATGPVSETDPAPAAAAADGDDVLLRADNLVKYFPIKGTGLFREKEFVHAVDGVSLSIRRGQTFGIVGETGCGKSTLARCVARLYDVTSGRIVFDGRDITKLSQRAMRPLRREIQMIFPDPIGSLNPRRRVGSIIGDPFAIHKLAAGSDRKRRVQELMERVGLNPEHFNRFPAEFSGGQRQQIILAGDVPSPVAPPSGCRFHPRCPKAAPVCVAEDPPLEPRLGDGPEHPAACHLPMAEGENLADFRPSISEQERVVEVEGSLLPEGAEPADIADALPARGEGGTP